MKLFKKSMCINLFLLVCCASLPAWSSNYEYTCNIRTPEFPEYGEILQKKVALDAGFSFYPLSKQRTLVLELRTVSEDQQAYEGNYVFGFYIIPAEDGNRVYAGHSRAYYSLGTSALNDKIRGSVTFRDVDYEIRAIVECDRVQ